MFRSNEPAPCKVVIVRHEGSWARETLAKLVLLFVVGFVILVVCVGIAQFIATAVSSPRAGSTAGANRSAQPASSKHQASHFSIERTDSGIQHSRFAECDNTTPGSAVRKLCEEQAADRLRSKTTPKGDAAQRPAHEI